MSNDQGSPGHDKDGGDYGDDDVVSDGGVDIGQGWRKTKKEDCTAPEFSAQTKTFKRQTKDLPLSTLL